MVQPYTQNTPLYLGLKAALEGDDVDFDLRAWRDYATAPIDLVRHDAIALSFEPHTEFFGEEVERHLLGNVWEYFRWRNYREAIDIYAADVGFTYEYWFTPDAQIGDRAYLDICIVPPLAFHSHVGVIEEISRTIHWLYPHYSDRGRLTVNACPQAQLNLYLQIASAARVQQVADAVSQGQPPSPSPLSLPVAPTGLTAVGGNRSVSLSWDDPNNGLIVRYEVRRRASPGLTWGAWANVPDSNSYTTSHVATGLEVGTTYNFQIRAVTAGGNGAISVAVSAATAAAGSSFTAAFSSAYD